MKIMKMHAEEMPSLAGLEEASRAGAPPCQAANTLKTAGAATATLFRRLLQIIMTARKGSSLYGSPYDDGTSALILIRTGGFLEAADAMAASSDEP